MFSCLFSAYFFPASLKRTSEQCDYPVVEGRMVKGPANAAHHLANRTKETLAEGEKESLFLTTAVGITESVRLIHIVFGGE